VLYGPDGALVKSVSDTGLKHDLPLAYQAKIGRASCRESVRYGVGESGTYDLRLAKVPGAFVVPAGDEGGPMTNGADHTGAITLGDLDPWTFSAGAVRYINVTVVQAYFHAMLVLYGPDGALVKSASDTGLKHDLPLAYQA